MAAKMFHIVVSCRPVAPVAAVLAKKASFCQPRPILLLLTKLQAKSCSRVPKLSQLSLSPTQYWLWTAKESPLAHGRFSSRPPLTAQPHLSLGCDAPAAVPVAASVLL